ncbi:hypothetical protein CVT26_007469 [Gymnopilus dilepis]|uniref:Uncharacterized protein n=1 Tax=Gymnopilus dilepis TaxID=231916 RepID=A0A409W7U3_9AGAR|nr:hypothetical protein CVT26_007469 [Gymnopilus dilepis]
MSASERIVAAVLDQIEMKTRHLCADPRKLQAEMQTLFHDLREANHLIKATKWPYFNLCTVLIETFRKADQEKRPVLIDEVAQSLLTYDKVKQLKIEKARHRRQELRQVETGAPVIAEQRHISQQKQMPRAALPGEVQPKERTQEVQSKQQGSYTDGPTSYRLPSGLKAMPNMVPPEAPVAVMEDSPSYSEGPRLSNTEGKMNIELRNDEREQSNILVNQPSRGNLPTTNQRNIVVPRWKSEPLDSLALAITPNHVERKSTMGRRARSEPYSPGDDTCQRKKRQREDYWDSPRPQFNRRMWSTLPGESSLKRHKPNNGSTPPFANKFHTRTMGDKGGDCSWEGGPLAEERRRAEDIASIRLLDALRTLSGIIASLQQKQTRLGNQLDRLVEGVFHQQVK